MDPDSSTELIRRAQDGDRDALDRLLARYIPRLRRWARGRLPQHARDLTDTDDLVQEALIRTLRSINGFEQRGEGALQAYLRQAVLNRLRDELRRSSRRPGHDELPQTAADDAQSPLELAIGNEALARYERALSRLSDMDREAVIARLELGCSYQEIAELVEKSTPDAARMAVNRALSTLARLMTDEQNQAVTEKQSSGEGPSPVRPPEQD